MCGYTSVPENGRTCINVCAYIILFNFVTFLTLFKLIIDNEIRWLHFKN